MARPKSEAKGPHYDSEPTKRMREVMEDHGLTGSDMARLMPAVPRTAAVWVQGVNPIPEWGQERVERVDTVLRVQRGEGMYGLTYNDDGFHGDRTEVPTVMEALNHLVRCPHCLKEAYQAVVAPIAMEIATRQGE